jgi:hypothetical protein
MFAVPLAAVPEALPVSEARLLLPQPLKAVAAITAAKRSADSLMILLFFINESLTRYKFAIKSKKPPLRAAAIADSHSPAEFLKAILSKILHNRPLIF